MLSWLRLLYRRRCISDARCPLDRHNNSNVSKHLFILLRLQVIEKISMLEEENRMLRDVLAERTEELNNIKKRTLSDEQTAGLLQEVRNLEEKLVEAKKNKTYFKEQYSEAVKEVHELKTKGQRDVQAQIQTNKEKVSQLSLDKFADGKTCRRRVEEPSDSDVLDREDGDDDDDTKL